MKVTRFTLIAGIVFVLVGILGFVPGVVHAPHATDPNIAVDSAYGRLFGLFPINTLHNLVHLAFGVWALIAARELASSVRFCRVTTIIYGLLTLMGLIPGLNTAFGLIPMFGHDVWLHAAITAATAYFGFVHSESRDQVFGTGSTQQATI